MKRWFSATLTFLFILTLVLGDAAPALAETDAEIQSGDVETDAAPADTAGAEGLTVEFGAWTEEALPSEAPAVEAETPAAVTAEYAAVAAEYAPVYASPEDEAPFAALPQGGVALIVESAGERLKVAFNTAEGIVTGYVAASDAAPLTGEETAAFLDGLAASGDAVLYEDNLDAPLATLACVFPADEASDAEDGEADIEADAEPETVDADAAYALAAASAGFSLEARRAEVVVGDTYVIGAVDRDGTAIDGSELSFASSDASVAAVDDAGVVTAVQSGSADISVTYRGQVLTSAISVPEEPNSILLNASAGTIGLKESYADLEVVMRPEGTAASVTWSSSNAKTVSVNAATGEIKGLKVGSATITAKTRNGKTAKCKVTVKKAPSKLTASPAKLALAAGGMTAAMKVAVPSGTASASIAYTSSDERVATVSQDGVITGVGRGSATVTATAFNGKKATCAVTVTGAPAAVAFESTALELGAAQTAALGLLISASDGSETVAGLSFSSSDERVLTVSGDGVVTAKARGTATVSVRTHNGVQVQAPCQITVLAAPAGVKLNAASGTIGVGERYESLAATLTPPAGESACAGSIAWTSSNGKVVSVDAATGAIKGVKAGSATITAKTYNGKKATCKVTVKKAPSKITLSPASVKLSADGMTAQLKKTLPASTASAQVAYASSDPGVAVVSESGLITATGIGTADITATTFNGKSSVCRVTVVGAPGAVSLSDAALSLGVSQKATLGAAATAADGGETVTALTFSVDPASPNPDCITLNAATGAIAAVKKGRAFVIATAHNGVASEPCAVEVLAAPAGVSLSEASRTIGVGERYEGIIATLTPPTGESVCAGSVAWSSSNSKVVSVDAATGAIKGVKAGSATITAKTYNGKKATCKVTVKAAPSKVTLNVTSLTLGAAGMSFQLKATVPSGSASSVITYGTSDPGVAVVSESGLITTVSPGAATITAATHNGKTAACALTVTGEPARAAFKSTDVAVATQQTFTPEITLLARDGSETLANLSFAIDPASPDPDCITVDPVTGTISGVKRGRAIVSFVTHNGVRAEAACAVTVLPAPTSVALSASSATLGVKETIQLDAALSPEDCMTSLTWTSSSAKVATVDQNGLVTAVAAGTATITATTHNGKSKTCKVTVKKAPTSVSISPAKDSLSVGASGVYKVTLSSGSTGAYTFSSSDESIATVDRNGVVTGLAAGVVTITVTTYNGKSAKATLTVREISETEAKIETVIAAAQSQLNKPYVYGSGYTTAANPKGFDCSGFVYWCYKKLGITLGNSAYKQGYDNNYAKITSIGDLKRGDVVCFNTESDSDLSDHTGIYLGDGYFIHASSSAKKVIISQFVSKSSDYYKRNFSWGRRILN